MNTQNKTLQHCNTATLQHCNTATLQHCNTATRQHGNTATRQHGNTATQSTAYKSTTSAKNYRQCALLILFFTGISSLVYAQQKSIMNLSPVDLTSLNSLQTEKLEKIKKSLAYSEWAIIQVDSLKSNATKGKLRLSLPSLKCADVTFTATTVRYKSESEYYWYGKILSKVEDSVCHGSIMLVASEGRKFGTIIVGSESYEYFDLSGGYQVLAKANLASPINSECGNKSLTLDTKAKPPTIPRGVSPCNANNNIVRVLVLWTQAAQNAEANMADRIRLCIEQTNQAYSNSQIGQFSLQLAGSQLLAGFNETDRIDLDVQDLAASTAAQNLRTNAQADIVILLTDGNYGNTFGIAYTTVTSAQAYGIVQVAAATGGRHTFAHEVGHLFGCLHNDDTRGTIEHGYTFKTGTWPFKTERCTIMFANSDTRELHYSNPDVKIKDEPTGTECCNDNAQQHRNTFATVAAFSPNPLPPFSVRMDIYQEAPQCTPESLEAWVQCGTAPYSYNWEQSYDGVDYWYIGNEEKMIQNKWCYNDYYTDEPFTMFYRLTVTDANNSTVSTESSTTVYPVQSGSAPRMAVSQVSGGRENTSSLMTVFPNPAKDQCRVKVDLPYTDQAKIEILDMNGRLVRRLHNATLPRGRTAIDLPVGKLANGAYLIKLQYRGTIETKKIIIAR